VDGFGSHALNRQLTLKPILKPQGRDIVEFGVNPWPAAADTFTRNIVTFSNRSSKRPIEGVFGSLSVTKKLGEMHNPSQIRFRELDTHLMLESGGHQGHGVGRWVRIQCPIQ